jgi:hypothetical protein
MFRPYMWAIFRLRFFNLQVSYTRCVVRLGGGGRDLVVSIVGTMTPGCYSRNEFSFPPPHTPKRPPHLI